MMFSRESDDQLYRQFLVGNNSAFDALMLRHGDNLLYYLYGHIHHPEDAEDLMIEAFARIMARRPRIREGNFKAYLYRTARNLLYHFYKNPRQQMEFCPEDPERGVAADTREEVPLPDVLLENDEKKEILHLCLTRIDPAMREAIWLVFFEDMSYKEAAKIMKVNTKKIDNLLARGKKTLRLELEKEGIADADI